MAKNTASFDEYLDQMLSADPALRARVLREVKKLEIGMQIAALRERLGLSQAEFARRIGTKQPTVARMERGDYTGYTLKTLMKIAMATGATLDVRLVAPRRRAA
jgi:DNA-binding transcriptional regulator YiaG